MSDELTEFKGVTEKYSDRADRSHLPSTEFRQDFSDWDAEEVHLRDYLDVIFRRRWLIDPGAHIASYNISGIAIQIPCSTKRVQRSRSCAT